MGNVIWKGAAEKNTSKPQEILGKQDARILRAPVDGRVKLYVQIGDSVVTGQTIAEISGHFISAAFCGIVRGLIHPDVTVKSGMRIGDLDPREDPRLCGHISDKSRAVGLGVLEAICAKFSLMDFCNSSAGTVKRVSSGQSVEACQSP
jgi:xanthine dehydrogenase accessory factor